jgi:hypothetical protein
MTRIVCKGTNLRLLRARAPRAERANHSSSTPNDVPSAVDDLFEHLGCPLPPLRLGASGSIVPVTPRQVPEGPGLEEVAWRSDAVKGRVFPFGG